MKFYLFLHCLLNITKWLGKGFMQKKYLFIPYSSRYRIYSK